MRGVKNKAGGTWTTSRYFSFIRSALRQAWSKYPVKFQVMNAAKKDVDWGRTRYAYQCADCKELFKATDVQVDHIKPAGSLKTYKDLPKFVETLFCESDNLQVLCKECHAKKTKEEKANGKK